MRCRESEKEIFCPYNVSIEKRTNRDIFCHHQHAGPGSKGSYLPLYLVSCLETCVECLLHVRARGGWKEIKQEHKKVKKTVMGALTEVPKTACGPGMPTQNSVRGL